MGGGRKPEKEEEREGRIGMEPREMMSIVGLDSSDRCPRRVLRLLLQLNSSENVKFP